MCKCRMQACNDEKYRLRSERKSSEQCLEVNVFEDDLLVVFAIVVVLPIIQIGRKFVVQNA
jgi:hypothetical protein